jgi:hypothetical protein
VQNRNLLEVFFESFVERLVEIASGDIDDATAICSISCLRKIQT